MTRARAYLDHNATTPLRPEARAALTATLDLYGNASSVHAEGRRARSVIETARQQVAALVEASPRDVVFTSGGTEGNNAVLQGGWDCILMGGIEHDSVLAPARSSGAAIVNCPVSTSGFVDLTQIDQLLAQQSVAGRRVLLTLQMANNETGVLQPVAEAAGLAKRYGACVHCDAVQIAGKVPFSFRALGIDLATISAHKIGGPKGIGALIVREGVRPFGLTPLLTGGGQERGLRAGTEDVAGIAAFGAAAQAVARDLESLRDRLAGYQRQIEIRVQETGAAVIGLSAPRLANTSCIVVPGQAAETLVIALDLAGVAISAGAACSSGKVKTSHVLSAMGFTTEIAGSAIRVSTGWTTTQDDIDAFLAAFEKVNQSRRPARKVA